MHSTNNNNKRLSTIWCGFTILFLMTFGCAQKQEAHEHENDLSGIWDYHTVYFNASENQYVDSHVHVKLTDDGSNVEIDHCLQNTATLFRRDNNILTNDMGQSLEVIHEDKINSIDVPKLSHMLKRNVKHDIKNAGSISIESELFQSIDLTQNVCAQRIFIKEDETLLLNLSLPFEETYLEITLEVADVNKASKNLTSAIFRSPNLMTYFGLDSVNALSGHLDFLELSETRAVFYFSIEVEGRYSNFIADRLNGFANIAL